MFLFCFCVPSLLFCSYWFPQVEERIPGMSTQPAAAAAAPAVPTVVSDEAAANQRKTAADRRAANRRVVGKSGCFG